MLVTIQGPTVRVIYSDQIISILPKDRTTIARASHVEPVGVQWYADLSPVDGPKLGPFDTRTAALKAEVLWLSNNLSTLEIRGNNDRA